MSASECSGEHGPGDTCDCGPPTMRSMLATAAAPRMALGAGQERDARRHAVAIVCQVLGCGEDEDDKVRALLEATPPPERQRDIMRQDEVREYVELLGGRYLASKVWGVSMTTVLLYMNGKHTSTGSKAWNWRMQAEEAIAKRTGKPVRWFPGCPRGVALPPPGAKP